MRLDARALLLAGCMALPAVPAAAADVGSIAFSGQASVPSSPLTDAQRSDYRQIFAAIDNGDWADASARLDAMPYGPLHDIARAELYLAKGSPKVELEPLMALIARTPELPEAPQLARLAQLRGAEILPELPQQHSLTTISGQPRRGRARSLKDDPSVATVEALIQPLIVDNQPAAAEAVLDQQEATLIPEALTEYQQRIAWSYYIVGDDAAARRLAGRARVGSGEWAVQAEWVAGLAAWRMNDCDAAANSFAMVGAQSSDVEMVAAANYWAARADMMCGRPERVQPRLRTAARLNETFYGLLAATALGLKPPSPTGIAVSKGPARDIASLPNVRAAIALNDIGERGLADQFIKYQARIGTAAEHGSLLRLAADLNLPSTQIWLAYNVPPGAAVSMTSRYPAPDWKPKHGWRVDPSLVFAHTLQESGFRTQIVSAAGARGLMQVRPGTAGDIARSRGETFDSKQLSDPTENIEFGQTYLEQLRDAGCTGGLLPKVIAAFNAGPAPVAEWNSREMDKGDPLLYIESIPYWETRGYVPIILRNYWVYEQELGRSAGSREALAQGLWPRFPGLPGPKAVRIQAPRLLASSGTR
jgi:soluble lytic murein transglycosylase